MVKLLQLAFEFTKLACRALGINSSASSLKINSRTNLDELVRALAELQDLLSQAEYPYFELKNGDLRAVERLFRHEEMLAQLRFYHSEVRYG